MAGVQKIESNHAGAGLRIGIVVGRFNENIGDGLLASCLKALASFGVRESDITVASVPAVTIQPVSQVAAEGDAVLFGVYATGGNLAYQWKRDGVNIAGATARRYSMAAASAASMLWPCSPSPGSSRSRLWCTRA